jgi:hypothetical protein
MSTAQLPYAYLTRAGEWTYRFSRGLAQPDLLVINDADADGSLWACDEPEGWQGVTPNTVLDERQYGDGAYAGDTTFGARVLTFDGTTVCPDRPALLRAMALVRAISMTRVALLYTQEEDPAKSLWLRAGNSQPKLRAVDGLAFDWSFVMVAEDPWKFAAGEATTSLSIALAKRPPGRVYNRVYPYIYGAQSAEENGRRQIVNSGDEWGQAIYVITGPVVNPTVSNTTTGETAGFNVTLKAGDTLVIDTAKELVTWNGAPYYDNRATGFAFPRMAPADPITGATGVNEIRYDSDSDPSDGITRPPLTVTTASTWK